MYILDKLLHISSVIGQDTVDGELATYFINHLDQLPTLTLQKCIRETGVSKASIHRFYDKAGFINFKSFINGLDEEAREMNYTNFHTFKKDILQMMDQSTFESIDESTLIRKIASANTILFYGDSRDYYSLATTLSYLRKKGKNILFANKWSIDSNYEMLKHLNENDVFVMINRTMNIQNYHETSMNNEYLLNFEKLKDYKFHKYYLGQGKNQIYLSFESIKLSDYDPKVFILYMSLLDQYLYQKLSEEL